MRIDSRDVLNELKVEYISYVKPAVEPEYIDVKFKDILPEFSLIETGDWRLYEHQYRGYKALRDGYNVILKSGTGSGKTEVWVLHVLNSIKSDPRFKTLVLYPTLALANDQIRRIEKYAKTINATALQLDAPKKELYVKQHGMFWLREKIASTNILISNPAFILNDVKKLVLRQTSALLVDFYSELNMIVIDELDFYYPRSLSLLLALLKILCMYSDTEPQIAILTATLSNPEDLGVYLKEITGRNYVVVEGKPFEVENRVYIILGWNLKEQLWNRIKSMEKEILSSIEEEPIRRELVKALKDYDYFVRNVYRVVAILQSRGFDIRIPQPDYTDIISKYLDDEYLTLVFTSSISHAEEVVRKIKSKYGGEAPVETHHHLKPKAIRESIEDRAKRGEIKVLVSPRTLSQGIDIGTVARVVHLGLPDTVKEFIQREGRKGRRRELLFSESIIIPLHSWDRELLSQGLDALNKWLNLGVEKTIVNPNNLYLHLFLGICKLLSPWFREELSSMEKKALESIGVLKNTGVDYGLARRVFEYINYYEYAPPYGIKRYLITRNGEVKPLEEISHCDLVEKFQPGNFDYVEEAIVTSLETGASRRLVKAVYEKRLTDINPYVDEDLAQAIEEYEYIKRTWGEKPSFIVDFRTGRLSSEEICVVYVPRNGFGKFKKIPNRCVWKLRSEKPRVTVIRDKVLVYYDRKTIYVPTPTAGQYSDFTYGYLYPVNPVERSDLLRLALAALMIILRRVYGIRFETIMYDVVKLGEFKYISLHEPESTGLIDQLDWLDIRRAAEKYVFDDLDRVLLLEVDEIAYSIFVSYGLDWSIVTEYLLRVIDYILAKDRIRVKFAERELAIPKPSVALKYLSLVALVEAFNEESMTPSILTCLAAYDGSEDFVIVKHYNVVPFMKPPEDIRLFEKQVIDKVLYEDFKLIVPDKDLFITQLKTANLRGLVTLIESMSDKIIDLNKLSSMKGFSNIPYELIYESIRETMEEFSDGVSIFDIVDTLTYLREKGKMGVKSIEKISKYLKYQSHVVYYTYLILSQL
ncbi:MAG: DEAD/DEAH box helicase [Desulfurococcaceae archaeon]